jgi:hypothetical protein
MIDDDENLSKPNNNILEVFENDNLLQICFDFCDIDDILNLSLVCSKFYKITKLFDYKFEDKIEKNFFSNYSNYE